MSECVRKQLNMRHILSTRGLEGPLPHQWIVSAGLPKEAVQATRGRQTPHWPRGVIGLPDMLTTSIIAVNKLPETPSTLPLQLMGRGRTLRRAVEELRALPEDEFQRCATLPVLIRYRITASALPVLPEEEEEYLVNTEEIIQFMIRKHGSRELEKIEQLKQEVLQERQEAEQVRQQAQQEVDQARQHERSLVLRLLTRRFGSVPPHVAQRIQMVDVATLERYAERLVVVSTIEDVIADA